MKKIFLLIILISFSFAGFFEDGMKAYNNAHFKQAANLFKAACDNGNFEGCNILGIMYEYGRGVILNDNKAMRFYKKSCNNENAKGCYNLGLLYYKQAVYKGNEYNIKAVKYFKKACDKGYGYSCYFLASLYYFGVSVKQNYQKALYFYKKGCFLGNEKACYKYKILKKLINN